MHLLSPRWPGGRSWLTEGAGSVHQRPKMETPAGVRDPGGVSESPGCPKCGALMQLRQGRNGGGRFWGCTDFPRCRGTRDLGDDPESPREQKQRSSRLASLPVEWTEYTPRAEFVPEYVSVGAMPGVLRDQLCHDARLRQVLSQCVLLSRRDRVRRGTTDSRLASALLLKLLRRGRTSLSTLNVEREALRAHGLLDQVSEFGPESPTVGWDPRPGAVSRVKPEAVLSIATERMPFILDPAFGFDSGSHDALLQTDTEAWFLNEWVPTALGEKAGHWFTPQAPLDKLLESGGKADGSGARRVDFLFHHPGGQPFAIEIDGPEHGVAADVDETRDDSLRSIGIDVVRVTNAEVLRGHGNMLDRIRNRCLEALEAFPPATGTERPVATFVFDCATAAKVQLAVARAVEYGWLTADEDWDIDISGTSPTAAAGVRDALALLAGFDVLYGGRSVPASCTVRTDRGLVVVWTPTDDGEWVETTDSRAPTERVRIAVESWASAFHASSDDGLQDFVIRPAFIPALIATEQSFDLGRRAVTTETYREASAPLTLFLRNVFRKREFRPLQGEAIFNALRQKDCVVLLPTGAGKSLIYQLAGLLMPGLTLVVDPIIALIEDQVEGLRAYGIDRAVPITGAIDEAERDHLLRRVERGEYQFVLHSPERLQSSQFRSALRALVDSSLVNLAVIDEAHCVSEWGHDFRPAYLNLGHNLRHLGADRDDRPPPLLALTGTASRAVLRDMLADLGIDKGRSDALIRPASFDRPEIRFEIVRTSPTIDPQAALRGVLNALPGKFGLPRTEFYRQSGSDTASGIVFVPTVKARMYGLRDACNVVRQATGSQVTHYSGKSPWGGDSRDDRRKWDDEKRANAAAFKANRVPVLVATKAFGMGIDKPNIRYTVHFGMPMSLESFYQEAGRAGRDGKPALSSVIFSEYDETRSDKLLDPDLDLDALHDRFREVNRDRYTGDDVTRGLWFHLQAFGGAGQEVDDAGKLIDALGDLSSSQRLAHPFEDDGGRQRQEKAIYRLLKLGVIRDYEVDWGGKKFVIHANPFDFDGCKQRLTDYVRAAKPGKSQPFIRRANEINDVRPRDRALALTRMLIDFTYDEIERSRRRSMLEAALLARQASSDSEIRKRLLDYLQEGVGAERIEQLLESEEVELSAWWEFVDTVQTEMDAGELRGLCIRALESDPDHPGLLLTRALAEAMCSDHDASVSAKGIDTAIRTGIETYEMSRNDIDGSIGKMFDLAATRARDLGPPLTVALLDLADTQPECAFVGLTASRRAAELDDPRVRAVIATRRTRNVVDQLERAAVDVVHRYKAPGITEALGAGHGRNG